MNLMPSEIFPAVNPDEKIRFDDFDISWVGENRGGNYCFGSEDGRYRTSSDQGPNDPASPSGEAINGIAFSGRAMAVSTRCDVSFIVFDKKNDAHRAVHRGGAHGVIATSGGFAAPLGTNGLLTMKPMDGSLQLLATSEFVGDPLDLYKLASCCSDENGGLAVGAARRAGLMIMELKEQQDRITLGSTHRMSCAGLDIVDVCSLNSASSPRAVAWLGIDGSIHLSRDILEDRPIKTLRIAGLRGKAYTILQARGHLFLLTSKLVYVFIDFVARFLGGILGEGQNSVLVSQVSASEIYIAHENLLIQMENWLDVFSLDALARTATSTSHSNWVPEWADIPWERSTEIPSSSSSESIAA